VGDIISLILYSSSNQDGTRKKKDLLGDSDGASLGGCDGTGEGSRDIDGAPLADNNKRNSITIDRVSELVFHSQR